MSWKKMFVCDISGKKLFVFAEGEKKSYVFLLEGKKKLIGNKNHTPPPGIKWSAP